jgi:chromosome segregation ATPase
MSLISPDVIVGEIQEIVEEILKGKGDYKTVEIKPESRQQHTMIEKAVDCLRRSKMVIEFFKDQVEDLFKRLDKSESDRELRLKSIRDLGLKLDSAEAQSNERMEVIKRQENEFSEKLQEIEADRAARLVVIKALSRKINELQGFDIRSLGFKGVCSFFARKLLKGRFKGKRNL